MGPLKREDRITQEKKSDCRMYVSLAVVFLACVCQTQAATLPATKYDALWDRKCGKGEVITHLKSSHSNKKEDRTWTITCAAATGVTPGNAAASGYVNDYDRKIDYSCPGYGALVGIQSVHSNKKEDRRYNFSCAPVSRSKEQTLTCRWTKYVNAYDKLLDFKLDSGSYISGVESVHNNKKEDRVFRFDVCSLK